jgi:hypothetical protein
LVYSDWFEVLNPEAANEPYRPVPIQFKKYHREEQKQIIIGWFFMI